MDNEISQADFEWSNNRGLREIIRGICKEHIEIIKGHISQYHIHLFLSVPPHIAISKLVQCLKGKSSYKMLMEHKSLLGIY